MTQNKFRHDFEDMIRPLCSCNTEIKSNKNFLLLCYFYFSPRLELFDKLNKINSSFSKLSAKDQVLFGYSSKKLISLKTDIVKLVISFLIKSGRFDRPSISFNQ